MSTAQAERQVVRPRRRPELHRQHRRPLPLDDRGRARQRDDPGYPDVVARDDSPDQVREAAAATAWLLGLIVVFGTVCGAPFAIAREWGEGWGILAGIALGAAWLGIAERGTGATGRGTKRGSATTAAPPGTA